MIILKILLNLLCKIKILPRFRIQLSNFILIRIKLFNSLYNYFLQASHPIFFYVLFFSNLDFEMLISTGIILTNDLYYKFLLFNYNSDTTLYLSTFFLYSL